MAAIQAVAVSHLHNDHAGGLKHFAGRVPVHIQRAELDYGMSSPPGPSLKLLKAQGHGDRSMREISQVLHVSPRTITDMIDGLEGRGFVARCPHPSDRRVTLLHLTEAGASELAGANTDAERVAATAISGLDQQEQQTLRSLLARSGTERGTADLRLERAEGRDAVPYRHRARQLRGPGEAEGRACSRSPCARPRSSRSASPTRASG